MGVRLKVLLALGILFELTAGGLPYVPTFTVWQRPGRQSLAALTLWCHSFQGGLMIALFHLAARRCAAASTLDVVAGLVFVSGMAMVAAAGFALVVSAERRRRGRRTDATAS